MSRLPMGCNGGLIGVAAPLTSYPLQSTIQALYLGGSGRVAAVPTAAVQDATVYTPAAQLASETEVEDAHHDLPPQAACISARMSVVAEPTVPRTNLFGSLSDAVARLLDCLTLAPVVESALVFVTAEGVVLEDPSVSYMMAAGQGAATARVRERQLPPMIASTPPSGNQDPGQTVKDPTSTVRELQWKHYWPSPMR